MNTDERRTEPDILKDIEELCLSPGYIYVLAWVVFQDNFFSYSGDLKVSDIGHLYSTKRLIRTETSTLAGQMCKGLITLDFPAPETFQSLIDRTYELMDELHQSIIPPSKPEDFEKEVEEVFTSEGLYREAFFYSGEPAYYFQFRDFSSQKYSRDNAWFEENKSYSVDNYGIVIKTVCASFQENWNDIRDVFDKEKEAIDGEKLLNLFTLTEEAISERAELDIEIVRSVLKDFSVDVPCNESFKEFHDFNEFNAKPLIPVGDGKYVILNPSSVTEAFYESPYYWMAQDTGYVDTAMENRGRFSETFAAEKLRLVFGEDRVFENVNILNEKGDAVGEIDVLVIYCDRAIVVQAKSKKLTIESRKGNDQKIRDDFQKSIQGSYDQGRSCALLLNESAYRLIDRNSNEIVPSKKFSEIFIICTVLDSYPALSFQARQFLKYDTTDTIKPPFVMDIFLLDALAEMLTSPLRFLGYIRRRVLYIERVSSTHELTVLSYHLKANLHLDEPTDFVHLADDVSSHLDLSMMVRRDGIPGPRTPDGILTCFDNTRFSQLLDELADAENEAAINLGFLLLGIDGSSIERINSGLETIIRECCKDGKVHDFGIGFDGTGVTFHCNNQSDQEAKKHLVMHCSLKKYAQKTDEWFGVAISPAPRPLIRFVEQIVEP